MIANSPARRCSECPRHFIHPDPRVKVCGDECRRARRSRMNCARQRAKRPARPRAECPNCRNEFSKRRHDQKYCSSLCGAEHRNRQRAEQPKDLGTGACLNCGEPFTRKHPLQRYCTKRCQQDLIAERARRKYHDGRALDDWTIGELLADAPFETFKRLWPGLLCEEIIDCQIDARVKLPVQKVMAYVHEIQGRYDDPDRKAVDRCKTCEGCHEPFLPRRQSMRFCSTECKCKHAAETRRANLSPDRRREIAAKACAARWKKGVHA